ncbi:MAG: imidazole glycerol phosphate synthase subunit HisH [Gammaproteobacteria bacterium]|nr:imidazole glycerol phosphate synthase subunit HisH [Gammaproteobacteria bacterium]
MKPKVTVVDYGVGNLLSVRQALTHCGAEVLMAETAEQILQAERLVLPGVGAFANAMQELKARQLIEALKTYASSGRPFLGICLGMQLMLETTEEFGCHQGLGLIAGKTVKISNVTQDGQSQKVPHIGWNEIYSAHSNNTFWPQLNSKPSVYFVHSYQVVPTHGEDIIAVCDYGGHEIVAIIGRGQLWGCQFHPEKSAEMGLSLLSAFIKANLSVTV